jgi:diadenosine tetraphosphate (Ap4A) HIT family hydrolase
MGKLMAKKTCPFCILEPDRIISESDYTLTIRDGYPVSQGHTLIIPKRHVQSFFELKAIEKAAILQAMDEAKEALDKEFSPDGYNIGINDGEAAGQTIMHLHVHLIPRYKGDTPDPKGGVRWIFPDKAKYW